MAFVNGFDGDISVAGTPLKVKSWKGKLQAEKIETTRKGDGGWETSTFGVRKLEGTFEADIDTTIHATGTFPFPFGQAAVAFVLSMTDGTHNGGSFGFSGNVFDLDFTSDAKGLLSISGSYCSTGAVTYTPPA
jgi:hypothetical protein